MKTILFTLACFVAAIHLNASSDNEWSPAAEPEYPRDLTETADASGWTEVSGVYLAPPRATHALIQLHLLWAPKGKVEWSDVTLTATQPLPSRKVRIASAHFKPKKSKTP